MAQCSPRIAIPSHWMWLRRVCWERHVVSRSFLSHLVHSFNYFPSLRWLGFLCLILSLILFTHLRYRFVPNKPHLKPWLYHERSKHDHGSFQPWPLGHLGRTLTRVLQDSTLTGAHPSSTKSHLALIPLVGIVDRNISLILLALGHAHVDFFFYHAQRPQTYWGWTKLMYRFQLPPLLQSRMSLYPTGLYISI